MDQAMTPSRPVNIWISGLTIVAVAVLLLWPTLRVGITVSHGSAFTITWATQFTEQVRAGILYPRWLPDSFGGLGSPAFYFYPPLFFWIDAFTGAITGYALTVEQRLAASSLLILAGSGIAMYGWLRRETGNAAASLIGAIAYIAAPYHLLDVYIRGASAEFASYAVLPLVFLAVRLIAERRTIGPIMLALSYAMLTMTHLPTALLATVTLIPANVFFRAWRAGDAISAARLLGLAASAGLLGAGLAAIYLIPALSLQEWISSEALWATFFKPENSLLLMPDRWSDPPMTRMIAFFALSAAFVTVALYVALPLVEGPERRWEVAFWATGIFATLALLSGLFPKLWAIPLLAKVQFPYRLMVLVDFATVTGLCVALARPLSLNAPFKRACRAAAALALALAMMAVLPGFKRMIVQALSNIEFTATSAPLPRYEAVEYLPKGYANANDANEQGILTPNLDPALAAPLIACAPAALTCLAREEPLGNLSVTVRSDVPTLVTVRRFAFPSWGIEPDVSALTANGSKLVSFTVPAGLTSVRLERHPLPAEIWGGLISGISLTLIFAWALSAFRFQSFGKKVIPKT